MTGKTTIEWTAMPGFAPAVWNPTTGCTRVSAGCDNCYAFALHDRRYKANLDAANEYLAFRGHDAARHLMRQVKQTAQATVRYVTGSTVLPFPKQYDLPFSRVQLLEERLDVPLRTRKPTCYFVDSMADLFHEDVPDEFLERVWRVMAGCSRHRFLILTKRPERMSDWAHRENPALFDNIWLGTSVEDQASADERIPHLLVTPAAVRFLSCEPLLSHVDLSEWIGGSDERSRRGTGGANEAGPAVGRPDERRPAHKQRVGPTADEALGEARGGAGRHGQHARAAKGHHGRGAVRGVRGVTGPSIDWVIAGGESGPRARPMDLAWARSLRDQCAAAGVGFFMKQLGSKPYEDTNGAGLDVSGFLYPHREAHGRDVDEWPEDLRIRTWPQ